MRKKRVFASPPHVCSRCRNTFMPSLVLSQRRKGLSPLCPPCVKRAKNEKQQRKTR